MKASVVVPAYNAEKNIAECLQSVLEQDFPLDYEVVVVNDGSRDTTPAIAQKFPVKLVTQANQGPAAARNRGAREAKGEFVLFIDADCVAEKSWLREMLEPFADSAVAGVQGRYKCRQPGMVSRFMQLEIEERYEKMARQRFVDHVGTYAAAYRRDVFERLGGFDEHYPIASGEDIDFSYKLAKAGHKLVFRPEAAVYHNHPASLGHYLKVKFWRAYWRVRMYKAHADKIVADSYTSQSIKLQLLSCYVFAVLAAGGLLGLTPWTWLAAPAALWFVSMVKFWWFALTHDFFLGLLTPFLVLLRAIVFSAGFALGIIREGLR